MKRYFSHSNLQYHCWCRESCQTYLYEYLASLLPINHQKNLVIMVSPFLLLCHAVMFLKGSRSKKCTANDPDQKSVQQRIQIKKVYSKGSRAKRAVLFTLILISTCGTWGSCSLHIAYYHIRFCFFLSALCLNFHTKPHLFLQLYLIVERHLYHIIYIVYTTMKITKSGTVCQTSSSYTERCMFAASEITKVSKSCQPCNDRHSSCKSSNAYRIACQLALSTCRFYFFA